VTKLSPMKQLKNQFFNIFQRSFTLLRLIGFLAVICMISAGTVFAQSSAKTLVVGGNGKVSLGQVISGFNRGHVGIRMPISTTSGIMDEDNPLIPFSGKFFPNPCNGVVQYTGPTLRSIQAFTILGNELESSAVSLESQTITFPARGTYIIKIVTELGLRKSFTIIYK